MRRSVIGAVLIIFLLTFSGCFEKTYTITVSGFVKESTIPYDAISAAVVYFSIRGVSKGSAVTNTSGAYTGTISGVKMGDEIDYYASKSGYINENGMFVFDGSTSINVDIFMDMVEPEDISISGYATLMNLIPPTGSISSVSKVAKVKTAVAPEPTQVIISPKISARIEKIEGFLLEKGTKIEELNFESGLLIVDVPKGVYIDDFIEQIEAEGWANYVEPNSYAIPTATKFIPIDPLFSGYQWNMYATSMPYVWGMGSFGSGIVVAVIDTGVDVTHPDLQGRLLPQIDVVYDPGEEGYCIDRSGHGTHVTGIIAAIVNNLECIAGMNNRNVTVLPIKAHTDGFDEGVGTERGGFKADDLVAAINDAIDAKVDIINLSLGWTEGTYVQSVANAITSAHNAGIAVVAAAGNGASVVVDFPANQPNVVAVSSVDSTLSISNFSDYGTEVDFAAPGGSTVGGGEFIYSTYPIAKGGFGGLAGTSQASPHVAALIAMLMTRGATRNEALYTMSYTAQLDERNSSYYGSGLINAYAALNDLSMDMVKLQLMNSSRVLLLDNIGMVGFDRSFSVTLPDSIPPGSYYLYGLLDMDSSGWYSYGDYYGAELVNLTEGQNTLNTVLKLYFNEDPEAPGSTSSTTRKKIPVPTF